ncbi:hypothetical protein G4Z16_15375 [Streptomyces bathyalis]|uniref:Uncharacterized protein n=1 Tax=Streptomyces bathyalis TaxID=2710756 RepID=A0A7T1WSH6_9ACTN|nr:hypothetical protein [Streptomyces bathyalis]QPP07541.1 hypothetical protein G4Z16_15375 [Streptomyces bathyalis]
MKYTKRLGALAALTLAGAILGTGTASAAESTVTVFGTKIPIPGLEHDAVAPHASQGSFSLPLGDLTTL